MNARWGLALFLGLPVAICGGTFLALKSAFVSHEELRRLPSPDGRLTAVLSRTDAGATTGYGYAVEVDGQEAFMAYDPDVRGAYGMKVRWRDARTLEVTFDRARWVRVGRASGLKVVVRGKVEEP